MSNLQAWAQNLETTALVGTGRRAPGAVPPALGTPSEGDPQRQLLDQAALFDVLSRAGARVGQAEPEQPAPPQTRPPAPAAAAQLLALLLRQSPLARGLTLDCTRRWLSLCAERGYSVPTPLLAELLPSACRDQSLQGPLREAWGERGRWLAGLFWPMLVVDDTATPDLTDDDWRSLPAAEAAERLTNLRATEPEAARARVQQLFGGYSAKERLTVLGSLRTGLSLGDEPFLEEILTDRALTVRELAASLLRSLPGSALTHRMGQRLVPLIEHQRGGLLRKPVVRIVAPAGFDDDAAARDGLPATVDSSRRARQLRELLAAASPHILGEVTGLAPKQLVAALDMVPEGWVGLAQGVLAHRDREWAPLLISHPKVPQGFALLPLLDPDARARWIAEAMKTRYDVGSVIALGSLPQPWPLSISGQIAERLATDSEPRFAQGFSDDLLGGFGPDVLPLVQKLTDSAEAIPGLAVLRRVRQFASFNQSIEEAFASAAPTPKEETA